MEMKTARLTVLVDPAKKKAFEAKGVQVGRSPSEAAAIAASIVNS